MKIFSKFHDYYDSVLKFSQEEDDGVVYRRDIEELTFDFNQAEIKELGYVRHFKEESVLFLGFCGKIYPIYHKDFSVWDKPETNKYQHTYYIGKDDDLLLSRLDEYYERHKNVHGFFGPNNHELNFLMKYPAKDSWWARYSYSNPFDLETFFVKYETPIFLFEYVRPGYFSNKDTRWRLTKNICLKDYDFQKVVDPFTAFQEISMFFNSVLTNVKNPIMPVGDDKVLAASKGFDKWSFRKIGENSK